MIEESTMLLTLERLTKFGYIPPYLSHILHFPGIFAGNLGLPEKLAEVIGDHFCNPLFCGSVGACILLVEAVVGLLYS